MSNNICTSVFYPLHHFSSTSTAHRNLVMGSGFLALPSAFVSTGLVLGTAVLLVCMGLLRVSEDSALQYSSDLKSVFNDSKLSAQI